MKPKRPWLIYLIALNLFITVGIQMLPLTRVQSSYAEAGQSPPLWVSGLSTLLIAFLIYLIVGLIRMQFGAIRICSIIFAVVDLVILVRFTPFLLNAFTIPRLVLYVLYVAPNALSCYYLFMPSTSLLSTQFKQWYKENRERKKLQRTADIGMKKL